MQKTAKNISLSIAGMMVAVPANADLASIDYVQRWVQNQSPIPAGSVISGYASGSYGSYLLAGSSVGGPYSGVSISDFGSQITPYIRGSHISGINTYNLSYVNNDLDLSGSGSFRLVGGTGVSSGYGLVSADKLGSKIAGYEPAGSAYTQYVAMLTGSTGAIVYKDASGFISGFLSPYGYWLADVVKSNAYSWFSPNPGSGSSSPMSTYISTYGSYIAGYQGASGTMTKILGFTGTGSSVAGETAKWFSISDVLNSGGLGYTLGVGSYGSEIVISEMGNLKRMYISTFGSIFGSYLKGSQIGGYDVKRSGTGSFMVLAGWDGYDGDYSNDTPSWVDGYAFGSYIAPFLAGSQISGMLGSKIVGYGSGDSAEYVLGAGNASGSASWVKVSGGGLSNNLFIGSGSTSGVPNYILGNATGGTGAVPGYYNVTKMGTVIGTVNGSQIKIEQTTTAADLQKNTGTIYFPVVQDGTIYGVTLNDFYILMNAQF